MDTRILLTDAMLLGPNGAALVNVLQAYAPDNVKLERLDMVHNELNGETRVFLFFHRNGDPKLHSVSVVAGTPTSRQAYLDHQLLLSKLALVS